MTKPEDTTTAGPLALSLHAGLGPLPEADMKADPCSDDGTQTDYYTAGTVHRLLAAERERCAKLCEALERKSGNAPYTPNGFTCAAAIRRA